MKNWQQGRRKLLQLMIAAPGLLAWPVRLSAGMPLWSVPNPAGAASYASAMRRALQETASQARQKLEQDCNTPAAIFARLAHERHAKILTCSSDGWITTRTEARLCASQPVGDKSDPSG